MTKPIDPSKNDYIRSPLDDSHILSGPFWGELRVFLAVAKAKSFNRAADELKMSQPTVSRQVRRLQDVMGAQLVVPTQAGITLTRQGKELAHSLRELDRKLFDISNDLNAEARTAEGTVRLAASEALAGLFVAPALLSFNEVYPRIRLQICTPRPDDDFRATQADVMIAVRPSQQSDVVSRQLGYLHLLPAACQPYIERYGVPTRSNLSAHCFLLADLHSKRNGIWDSWLDLIAQGVITHSCDNLLTYSLMIRNGLGIGLAATTALADPTLLPLELGVHIRAPLHVSAPGERLNTKAVRIVYDWLSELFGETVPWFRPDLDLEILPRDALSPILNRLLGDPGQNP
jgi:DNA-binding transcriptional LysR family regulator